MKREHSENIEAIRAFNRFYTNIIGVVDRHILGSPFSLTEARILLEVYHHDCCKARAIRETLNVNEGYLSRTIDKLVERGLIDKRRSPDDGRVFLLTLTSEGKQAFRKLNRDSGTAIAGMLGHLSDAEVNEVVAHMNRIEELLSRRRSDNERDT